MKVQGCQCQGSSLLPRTLVASSKLMEETCQDSNLLLGVLLLFTIPCGSIGRFYTHTHAGARLFKIQQRSNCTELRSHCAGSRSLKAPGKLKCTPCRKISCNSVAFTRTYTPCDTCRQHFELCSSDRPAWVYFVILVTLGLCFKLPCMQASKTTSILLYIQWLVIKGFELQHFKGQESTVN